MKDIRSGIYKIENAITGKVYIGSAVDVVRRFREHKCRLRQGVHSNRYLQASWNKHGKDSFIFAHIVTSRDSDLTALEQLVIDQYNAADRKFGYNLIDMALRLSGAKGMRHTEAAKRLISEASKRNAHLLVRGEKSFKAKLKESDINIIRTMSNKGFSQSVIADRYGVTKQCVAAVIKRDSWNHVPYQDMSEHIPDGIELRKIPRIDYFDNVSSVIKKSDVGTINKMLVDGIAVSKIADTMGISRTVMLNHIRRIDMGVVIRKMGRLKREDVADIRRLHQSGSINLQEIATMFGVSTQTVKDVVTNRTWREVIAVQAVSGV